MDHLAPRSRPSKSITPASPHPSPRDCREQEAAVRDTQGDIRALQETLEGLQRQYGTVGGDLHDALSELETVESDVQPHAVSVSFEDEKIAEFKARLEVYKGNPRGRLLLTGVIQTHTHRRDEALDRLQEAEAQRDELASEVEFIRDELSDISDAIAETHDELEDKDADLAAYRAELAACQSE